MVRTMRDVMPCIIFFQAVVFYCIQASNEHTEKPINTLSIPEKTKPEGIPADKDESFSYCDIFDVQPAGYVLFSNGTAYVKDYNKTYTEQFYYLDGDILVVCKPCDDMAETSNPHSKESNYIRLMRLLESIGIHASMVCLVASFVWMFVISFTVFRSIRQATQMTKKQDLTYM